MENETFIEQTKAYLLLVKEHEGNAAFQQMAHVVGGALKTTRKAGLKMWAKQIVTPPQPQPTPVVKPQAPTVPPSSVAEQPKGKAESKKQKLHQSKSAEHAEELMPLSTVEEVMEAFGGDGELMRDYLFSRTAIIYPPNIAVEKLAAAITEIPNA